MATDPPQDSVDLPPVAMDNEPVITPLAIIASKMIPSEMGPKRMVLVQWRDLPLEEASWEEWSAFKKLHHLEDKVFFEGQGSVTPIEDRVQVAGGVVKEEQGLRLVREQQHGGRPIRKMKIPARLDDYVR